MVQCYPRFLINNEEKDPKETQIGTDAGVEMRKYIREELIPKRKEELKTDKNKQDILSRLLRISFLHESKYDEERIVSNTMGHLMGAGETINNANSKALDQLLLKPEAMALAVEAARLGDDDKLKRICWEALRFNVPAVLPPRIVARDHMVNGHHFKKGGIVLVSRSAYFDPTFVESPWKINCDRPNQIGQSFHFGHGIHSCLGEHVAMAVMPMIIKELILHTGGVCRASPGTRGEMNFDGGPYIEYFWVKFNGKKEKIEAEKSYGSII